MTEQFANACSTAVAAGGYTAGSGVLNVDSTAAPWPQTGNYRIGIYDQSTGALKVLLEVTAVNSGTQFAVTAEGNDANAAEDDDVYGTIVTAAVMGALQSGALVLLEEHAASDSASLDFTDWYDAAYDEYEIDFVDLVIQTDNQAPGIQFSVDGGSNYDTGNNYNLCGNYVYITGGGDFAAAGTDRLKIGGGNMGNDANYAMSGRITLYGPANTSRYKAVHGQTLNCHESLGFTLYNVGGFYANTQAVNALRIICTSGNIVSGTVRIYGVAKA